MHRGWYLFPALFYSKLVLDVCYGNALAAFLAILVPVFVQVDVLENGARFGGNGDSAGTATFAKLIKPGDIYASAFEPSIGTNRPSSLSGIEASFLNTFLTSSKTTMEDCFI